MSQTHGVALTKQQWEEAAAAYELGHKHAAQIARELGVSAATVSREFARRGCVKGSRIAETIAEIETRLDAEANERARAKAAADAERKALVSQLVNELFDAFDAADLAGEPREANPNIARIGRELHLALR